MTPAWPWFALLAAFAALNWLASDRSWRKLIYLTKPAVMLVLLAILLQTGEVPGRLTWFFAGAVLGLSGDVFLMLPGKRTFNYGLAAFMAGHVAYVVAFQPHLVNNPLAGLSLAVVFALIALIYGRYISAHMNRTGRRRLRMAVLGYIVIISLMAWSASVTLFSPGWPIQAAAFAAAGGLMFLVSDGVLAWDRFISNLPHARLIVMATYHLAQAGIICGAIFSLN